MVLQWLCSVLLNVESRKTAVIRIFLRCTEDIFSFPDSQHMWPWWGCSENVLYPPLFFWKMGHLLLALSCSSSTMVKTLYIWEINSFLLSSILVLLVFCYMLFFFVCMFITWKICSLTLHVFFFECLYLECSLETFFLEATEWSESLAWTLDYSISICLNSSLNSLGQRCRESPGPMRWTAHLMLTWVEWEYHHWFRSVRWNVVTVGCVCEEALVIPCFSWVLVGLFSCVCFPSGFHVLRRL